MLAPLATKSSHNYAIPKNEKSNLLKDFFLPPPALINLFSWLALAEPSGSYIACLFFSSNF